MALVSAVIPTTGRTTLKRAARSVQDQTADVEAVVVLDRPEQAVAVEDLLKGMDRVRIIVTRGNQGAAQCRNIGTELANSEYVAYLDDDDWWESQKSAHQLDLLRSNSAGTVACTYFVFHSGGGDVRRLPKRLPLLDESVGSYAVTRDRLKFGSTCVQSSGIMLLREHAIETRWDSALGKHQDWDFVIRATNNSAVNLVWLPEYVTHIEQGSLGSISAVRDWRLSSEWLATHSHFLSARARADFAATHILRSAFASRSWRGVRRAVGNLDGNVPHLAAIVVGLSGVRGPSR